MVAGTAQTMAALQREVDAFGDSYTQDTDIMALRTALETVMEKYTHPYEGGIERAGGANGAAAAAAPTSRHTGTGAATASAPASHANNKMRCLFASRF